MNKTKDERVQDEHFCGEKMRIDGSRTAVLEYIKKGAPQFKANLHSHSNLSDGTLTPEELKAAYKSRGYSVLAITDHERPHDHSALSDDDFLMLTAYEAHIRHSPEGKSDLYGPEIHINLISREPHNLALIDYSPYYAGRLSEEEKNGGIPLIMPDRVRDYTPEYINHFVEKANRHGYICTHNHPTWSLEAHETVAQYRGFFSMEMCNYNSHIAHHIEYNANLYDRLMRDGRRIFCHSVDDDHNRKPFDTPGSDSFGGFTMILAEELTYPAIIDALEKGNFYSSMGPEIHELTFDGPNVHIETSPVTQIAMIYGAKRPQAFLASEDEPITSADFVIPESAPYVRFTLCDAHGRHTDTRGFFRDELVNNE